MISSIYNVPEVPPVIILGAARSGTRLLRRLVAATGRYAEVPYDVNYIWRYGNEACPHDVLPADRVTDRICGFIRERLRRCADLLPGSTAFVEKTVSNTLRIPFVKAVFPTARYIAIVRDGRDAAESAVRCWRQPPSLGPLLGKLQTFPWLHCTPYAWKYAGSAARRTFGLDPHLSTWGPRYPGIDDDLRRLSLVEVCARQWLASMEHYEQGRRLLRADQLLELKYEELVTQPLAQVRRVCEFLEVENHQPVKKLAQQLIRTDRVGTHAMLSAADQAKILPIVGPALSRWGYSLQEASHPAA